MAGFTLLELLVVLALMGLMLALALNAGPPRSPALVVRAATDELAAALAGARAEAITTDRPTSFLLRLAPPAWRVGTGRLHPLPPALVLRLTSAAGVPSRRGTAGIVFAPDGSTTGGSLDLALAGQRARLTVDWLTGSIRIQTIRARHGR